MRLVGVAFSYLELASVFFNPATNNIVGTLRKHAGVDIRTLVQIVYEDF